MLYSTGTGESPHLRTGIPFKPAVTYKMEMLWQQREVRQSFYSYPGPLREVNSNRFIADWWKLSTDVITKITHADCRRQTLVIESNFLDTLVQATNVIHVE